MLELCQRLLHGEDINAIIAKYPEIKRFYGKRLGCYHNASSPKDWSGDLVVRNVDCYRQWMFGRTKACELLKVDPAYFNPISGY